MITKILETLSRMSITFKKAHWVIKHKLNQRTNTKNIINVKQISIIQLVSKFYYV